MKYLLTGVEIIIKHHTWLGVYLAFAIGLTVPNTVDRINV